MKSFDAVKMNMLEMLKYAEKEYKEYETTGKTIYLQQAGEKLWNVFGRYLEYRNKRYYDTHQAIREASYQNDKLRSLLQDIESLHHYFYNPDVEVTHEQAKFLFKKSIEKMKNRIKMLR